MDKKSAFIGLIALSALSVFVAALDYLADLTLFNLGADSWMLVGIALGVWALIVKEWS
ncbi:MAG: hypothetical protein WD231_03355 [Candidatus Woykebacteria bacterium]